MTYIYFKTADEPQSKMFWTRFNMNQVLLFVNQEKEETRERLVAYSFPD